jgi:hypothetical protein
MTCPVRLVANNVLDAVDPCPLSAEDEFADSKGLVAAGVLPMIPVMAELVVNDRSLSTVPDWVAVVCTTI